MKSINSKNIGKTKEQMILDAFTKAINKSYGFIGAELTEAEMNAAVKNIQKQLDKFASKSPYSMGCHVEDNKCLICGSNFCEEDDCQLGVK